MTRSKKKRDPDEPKPLNFDRDEKKGANDGSRTSFTTPSDMRGDNKEEQYYQEEEALSPEEVKKRKEEGSI